MTFRMVISIGVFVAFMTMSCSSDNNINSGIKPPEAIVKSSEKGRVVEVDEKTQAQIITLALRDLNGKDSAVMGGMVYLLVPESVFKLLPREINGIKLVLLKGSAPDGELKVHVLTFTNWSRRDDTVGVKNTANFYGGNIGGCDLKFTKVESNWIEQNRECFAMAS